MKVDCHVQLTCSRVGRWLLVFFVPRHKFGILHFLRSQAQHQAEKHVYIAVFSHSHDESIRTQQCHGESSITVCHLAQTYYRNSYPLILNTRSWKNPLQSTGLSIHTSSTTSRPFTEYALLMQRPGILPWAQRSNKSIAGVLNHVSILPATRHEPGPHDFLQSISKCFESCDRVKERVMTKQETSNTGRQRRGILLVIAYSDSIFVTIGISSSNSY